MFILFDVIQDDKKQLKVIKEIAAYLNLKKTNDEIKWVCDNLFGGTTTFQEGQIETWKEYLNSEHVKEFKKYAGQLLIDLGYEKDFDW